MSVSRDRQEYAEQIIADASKAGTVSEACLTCLSTRAMAIKAMQTDGHNMSINGAGNVARQYVNQITGCLGVAACKGLPQHG